MSDPQPLYVDPRGIPYFPRKITRLVRPWLHVEGHSATNLRGDIEHMLSEGTLDEKDARHLSHIVKCCIRLDETQPDGLQVSMSNRQFSSFVGIRRRFIADKQQRLFDSLNKFNRKPNNKAEHQ